MKCSPWKGIRTLNNAAVSKHRSVEEPQTGSEVPGPFRPTGVPAAPMKSHLQRPYLLHRSRFRVDQNPPNEGAQITSHGLAQNLTPAR